MQQHTVPALSHHRKALAGLKAQLVTLDALGANIAAAHLSLAVSQLEEDILHLLGEPLD